MQNAYYLSVLVSDEEQLIVHLESHQNTFKVVFITLMIVTLSPRQLCAFLRCTTLIPQSLLHLAGHCAAVAKYQKYGDAQCCTRSIPRHVSQTINCRNQARRNRPCFELCYLSSSASLSLACNGQLAHFRANLWVQKHTVRLHINLMRRTRSIMNK